jgi:hypothetical protein
MPNNVANNALMDTVFIGQLLLAYWMLRHWDALLSAAGSGSVALANLSDLFLREFGNTVSRASGALLTRWLRGLDPATALPHVAHIVRSRADIQMIGTDAIPHVAVMQQPSIGRAAIGEFPGDIVGLPGTSAGRTGRHAAVSPGVPCTRPQPARIGLLDFLPEAFCKRSFHMLIVSNLTVTP